MKVGALVLYLLVPLWNRHHVAHAASVSTFTPTEDSYIRGGVEDSHGSSKTLLVKEKKPTSTRLNLIRRTFLQFDVSSLPTGSQVSTATLKMTIKGGQSGAIVRLCESETFDEDLITWSNPPAYDPQASLGDVGYPTNGDNFMEWEIGAYLQQQLDSGHTTLAFALDASPVVDRYVTYRSKENGNQSNWPTLTVEYDDATPSGTSAPTASPTSAPTVSPTSAPSTSPTSALPDTSAPTTSPSSAPSTLSGYDAFSLFPVQDTYAKATNGGTNYGDSTRLDVKMNDDRNTYIKFDISNVVDSAPEVLLRLWAYTDRQADTSLHEVTSDWQELTLTWNNKPILGNLIETKPYPAQYESVTFDVTNYVNEQVAAGASFVSFAMIAATNDSLVKFYSREWETQDVWPTLEFGDVTEPPEPPTYVPPFSLAKFQPALSGCRLQWPTSSPSQVSNGEFEGYAVEAFHLVEDAYMQFTMSGQGNRCELRHNTEWAASDSVERSMKARVKLPTPAATSGQITFLQVHNKDFLTYEEGPLLRINWRADTQGYTDHIWASLRVSLDPKDVDLFPLFPRPEGFFDIELKLVKSTLTILIDGQAPPLSPQLVDYDLTYWDPMVTNLFKAGVYLNDGGEAAVTLFDMLEIVV